MPARDPLLIVIAGPTGSGKTALALRLAAHIDSSQTQARAAEIVSCDSVAVYCEFEIGTAKPTREERSRVPHHMIDVAAPGESFTAGDYARQARAALGEISLRGATPIVVGGTGLYLRALIDGLFAGPRRHPELRARLREMAERGKNRLHRLLARLDRESAARIHANDAPKLIRAIEVCVAAGQPMTSLVKSGRDPLTGFRILRLGLNPPRAALYQRLDARAQAMFDNGLVEETRELLARYPHLLDDPSSPLNALGYRQALQLIRGELTPEAALAAAQQGHRNYAKRQMTWFRREPSMQWINAFGEEEVAVKQALSLIAEADKHAPQTRPQNNPQHF